MPKREDLSRILIIGAGPIVIGQACEFDYCCVHASFALREASYETIMINCNPKTVSTDYNTSNRLYFEPLDFEHVLNIIETEKSNGDLRGVVVQYGGQTPLNLIYEGRQAITDLGTIRSNAVQNRVCYTTTIAGALAIVEAMESDDYDVYNL